MLIMFGDANASMHKRSSLNGSQLKIFLLW